MYICNVYLKFYIQNLQRKLSLRIIMPMKLVIEKHQLGSFLKLRCMICIQGEENEVLSKEMNVNDLATVQLKFSTKDSQSPLVLIAVAKKQMIAQDYKIKMKLSCHETDKPFYSEWICKNNEPKKAIGIKTLCDISLNEVRTCLLNVTISASKVHVHNSLLEKHYNDEDFTDFHLSSTHGSVAVHRVYLAAHSEVFKSMLSREWKETTEGKVKLKGVTLETLWHLKKYMYLGTLPDEGLLPLLLIARYYLIEELEEECVAKIAQTVKPGDWYSIFEFATENNIPELLCAVTLVKPESVLEGSQIMPKKISELNE